MPNGDFHFIVQAVAAVSGQYLQDGGHVVGVGIAVAQKEDAQGRGLSGFGACRKACYYDNRQKQEGRKGKRERHVYRLSQF